MYTIQHMNRRDGSLDPLSFLDRRDGSPRLVAFISSTVRKYSRNKTMLPDVAGDVEAASVDELAQFREKVHHFLNVIMIA